MYGVSFDVADEVHGADFVLPIGKAKVEVQGEHVTIVAHSRPVGDAIEAAKILKQQGISAEVINLRSIRPLDMPTVIERYATFFFFFVLFLFFPCALNVCSNNNSVKKTNNLVTVEGGFPMFGVGSEIIAQLIESEAFNYLDNPAVRITGADIPMPYAKNLEDLSLPNTGKIVEVVKKLLRK